MEIYFIPIVGEVFGTLLVVGVVAAILHYRLQQARSRIETEIQRLDLAYQRARESFQR